MMGGRIHAALQHAPLYKQFEDWARPTQQAGVKDATVLERGSRGPAKVEIMKGEALREGKKANDGIRYVKGIIKRIEGLPRGRAVSTSREDWGK